MGVYRGEIDRLREYGFSVAQAKDLAVKLSASRVTVDQLHQVFAFEGEQVPLVLALKRSTAPTEVLRAFVRATKHTVAAMTKDATETAAAIVQAAHATAKDRYVDVAKGESIARWYDRRCSPLQRFRVGMLSLACDFDAGLYVMSGPQSTATIEATDLEGGHVKRVAEVTQAHLPGARLDEVTDLIEQAGAAFTSWEEARDHLADTLANATEIRSLLIYRAMRADEDKRQLELLTTEVRGA